MVAAQATSTVPALPVRRWTAHSVAIINEMTAAATMI